MNGCAPAPLCASYHAWALLMSGRLPGCRGSSACRIIACIQEEAGSEQVMPGRMAALRAYTLLFQADMHARGRTVPRGIGHVCPRATYFLRSIVTWMLSLASTGRWWTSRMAARRCKTVARKGQEIGNPLIAVTALCHQARLQARQGRLHRARRDPGAGAATGDRPAGASDCPSPAKR